MKKTNFERYLKAQLRDSRFAELFEKAGEAWVRRPANRGFAPTGWADSKGAGQTAQDFSTAH
jgi:hypothetical protein